MDEARQRQDRRAAPRATVADRLHSAALHLVRTVRSQDVSMGLTPARASALSVLVFGGPRTIGELAAAEGVQSPTMTQLVNGLEALGLVRRRGGSGDRRKVVVEATDAGRRLLEEGRTRRVELLEELLDGMEAAELRLLEQAATLMEAAVARSATTQLRRHDDPRGEQRAPGRR